jgi:hypothetical protein
VKHPAANFALPFFLFEVLVGTHPTETLSVKISICIN